MSEFTSCDDCIRSKGVCIRCAHNYTDLFRPKQNELDKLFIGAPVVQVGTVNGSFVRVKIYDGNNKLYIRLPTIEEAPRNVWLAPWLEMPEELAGLNACIRFNKRQFHYLYNSSTPFNWNEVEAIMILEDFKK